MKRSFIHIWKPNTVLGVYTSLVTILHLCLHDCCNALVAAFHEVYTGVVSRPGNFEKQRSRKLVGFVLSSFRSCFTRVNLVLTDILHHGMISAFLQEFHHVVSSSA